MIGNKVALTGTGLTHCCVIGNLGQLNVIIIDARHVDTCFSNPDEPDYTLSNTL